jgi:hypothetical protein
MSPLEKATSSAWDDFARTGNAMAGAGTFRPWAETQEHDRIRLRSLVRAALEALMEPTGEMKDAGAESYGVPPSIVGQPTKAWQAMLRKVLEEK